MEEKIECRACGEIVSPIEKKRTTRQGNIISFFEYVYVCPNKKCGEILYSDKEKKKQ